MKTVSPRHSRSFNKADIDLLLERALEENGSVIIRRPGRKDVALIPAEKLRDLDTTDYLLASPRNRQRLLAALRDARRGKGRRMSLKQLRHEVGLDRE